jgi:hypothetical protein
MYIPLFDYYVYVASATSSLRFCFRAHVLPRTEDLARRLTVRDTLQQLTQVRESQSMRLPATVVVDYKQTFLRHHVELMHRGAVRVGDFSDCRCMCRVWAAISRPDMTPGPEPSQLIGMGVGSCAQRLLL